MTLSPDKQLAVLSRIWGNDRDGYVFLPWIPGTCKSKAERKANWKEGRAYHWPAEREAITSHLAAHTKDDIYFTPCLYSGKRRIENHAEPERSLYADLDPVDPTGVSPKPTIAWESSPGRYQGVWLLDRPRVGASWAGNENHRLTMMIGADPSGWDTTQVLRVPGSDNHKSEDLGGGGLGKLLWDNGPRYTWDDFSDLPEVVSSGQADENELVDDELVNGVDRHKVWSKVRLKLPNRIREFFAARNAAGGDRSGIMWEMERELAKVGCSLIEIVALVRPTVWNKFAGRGNELQTLKGRAAQAIAWAKGKSPDAVSDADDTLEVIDDEEKPNIIWLSDVVANPVPRPRWLVKDIWTRGACGFISGAPKSYKSWTGLDIAVSIASGEPFLGEDKFYVPQGPQRVLILQEEDDMTLVLDRMQNIIEERCPGLFWHGHLTYANNVVSWEPPEGSLPLALHVGTGFIASDDIWQAWLDNILTEGQFVFVLIDTLGTTAGDIDTDRASELMSRMLNPLKVLSKKHDCAVAIIHHNSKGGTKEHSSTRGGQRMLGSVALHAWVECALYFTTTGQEIVMEREAKHAADMVLKVRVPTMYAKASGQRQMWAPEIVAEASDDHTTTNDTAAMRQGATGRAGSRIAWEMKQMGAKTRGMTAEQVANVRGSSLRYTLKQMEAAVDNGYLTRDGDQFKCTDKE